MNNKKIKLEDKIMNDIKNGHIKLRSKYVFVAEKLGLNGGLFLSFLLAVFFLNLGLFYMKSMDNLEYLSFGTDGMLAFLESFPYHWLLISIIFIFLSGYIITKYDMSYKKPFKYIVIGMVIVVVCSGGVIAATGLNDYLDERAIKEKENILLKPFYGVRPIERPHGILGRVQELDGGYMLIGTPFGEKLVNIQNTRKEEIQLINIGYFVLAVGVVKDGHFYATGIKIVSDRDVMSMKRRIMDEFREEEFKKIEEGMRAFRDRKMRGCFRECTGSSTLGDMGGCISGCH